MDKPHLADWLQAVGTLAAFAITSAGLMWEARSRRAERRESDKALARCVVLTAGPDEMLSSGLGIVRAVASVKITVTNYSPEPITEIRVTAESSVGGETRGDDFAASIGPGQSHALGWVFAEPIEYPDGEIPRSLLGVVRPAIEYRIAGALWTRAGHLEPVRRPGR